MKGLSRMRGNSHVRFLGEGLAVMTSSYPILGLLFVVVRRLIFGDPVAGWASTICILLFVSGLQLFCLGIIGQYIAKIYAETKHRPHFIISESNKDSIVNIH